MIEITEQDRETLRKIAAWIKNFQIKGDGVTGRNSLSAGASYHVSWPARSTRAQTTATAPALVAILSNAAGGGKYNGALYTAPTADVSASGNLANADLGTAVINLNVLVLNTREVGKSTHDLAAAAFLPLVFPAVYRRTNSDGTAVYAIDGNQWEDCS